MLTELGATFGVDLAASTMVGDQEIDAAGGARGGRRPFHLAHDFFGWK